MNKVILIVTGTPTSKNKFDNVVKKNSWVWAINPNNRLSDIAKNSLFWSGVRDEESQKFVSEFRNLANMYFDFDEKYVRSMIEKFLADEDEYKVLPDGTKYENFLLVIHGLPKELYGTIEQEFGAFQVHLTSRIFNTKVGSPDVEERHDLCLYDDDEDFEERVENLIDKLTKTKKEIK